jgi:hypothetical protein
MGKNPLAKRKLFLFLILFAISLSFLFLPIEVKACSVPSERIGPVLRKGKIFGFKIYRMHKDHFLRYIGLNRNDTITKVNERKVSELFEDEGLLQNFKQNLKKNKHVKLKLLRREGYYEMEFILNSKNISKIRNSTCDGYTIDQSIPKKEMFDFYEMKKIE